jgi:hypothetical protein
MLFANRLEASRLPAFPLGMTVAPVKRLVAVSHMNSTRWA